MKVEQGQCKTSCLGTCSVTEVLSITMRRFEFLASNFSWQYRIHAQSGSSWSGLPVFRKGLGAQAYEADALRVHLWVLA